MIQLELTFDQACTAWAVVHTYWQWMTKKGKLGEEHALNLQEVDALFEEAFKNAGYQ